MRSKGAHAPNSRISRIVFAIPRTRITRFRLYASTCKLISVPICTRVLGWMNRPGFELPPEVGQTSRGSVKKYETEFTLEIVNGVFV